MQEAQGNKHRDLQNLAESTTNVITVTEITGKCDAAHCIRHSITVSKNWMRGAGGK